MTLSVQILWENADLWAIDKPAGQNVIPGRDPREGPSLKNALAESTGLPVFVLHRLDRDTSGLVLFAKSPEAHRFYSLAFEQRRVEKEYLAALYGVVDRDREVYRESLRAFGSGRMGVDPKGKPSETRLEVLKRFEGGTWARLRPVTGRRHQIRVHCAHHGHPIFGDPLYGPPPRPVGGAPRLLLHAVRLVFPLPAGGTQELTCPPPPDFATSLRVVGADQISYLAHTP